MGNLILCKTKPAARPYYVPELGIHLYTAEELSYYIYNHLLLIDESFPDERLTDFLHQLEQDKLEERIRRMREQAAGLYEILYVILQDLRYYSSAELFAFRKQLEQMSASSAAGRLKAKGDALFARGKYYSALRIYNQIQASDSRENANNEFASRLWISKGACYARVEDYREAMHCYGQAYVLNRDSSLPEKMYILNVMMGKDEVPSGLENVISEEKLEQYRSNLANRRNLAQYQGKGLEAAALMDKQEPERTEAFLELLYRWKEEYRKNQTT